MLPADRRRRILARLEEEGSVSIKELCAEFDVSHMTVHRDLDHLANQGQLRKVRGGAVELASSPVPAVTSAGSSCCVCGQSPRRNTSVICHFAPGEKHTACCPHCMLMYLSQRTAEEMPSAVLVTDFLYGIKVNAQAAHYVLGPDVVVCCTPTAMAFSRRDDAVRFQRGFGGRLLSFTEALQEARDAALFDEGDFTA